jgi:hypothetical protein
VKKESDRWDGDGHSHSYFTLAELKKYYEANSHTTHIGFLSERQKKELDEDGKVLIWNIENGKRIHR